MAWLRTGDNTFLVYEVREFLSWEYDNLNISIDTDSDSERSWWFGNGRECGKAAMDYLIEAQKEDRSLQAPASPIPTVERSEALDACDGELMMFLELGAPR